MSERPILEVRDLKKHFSARKGLFGDKTTVKAVDGVSFRVMPQESFAVVGESGCGKTTLGKLVLALEKPTAGTVLFDGQDMAAMSAGALRRLRREMQVIFQDPYSSLNPRMTVRQIVGEAIRVHGLAENAAAEARMVGELLDQVGLRRESIDRYPHEFSGGQRQRIGIARALAVQPEFIVCDEPISALDVSIQAQIVNLLQDLQERLGLTYLFISHDLKIVEHVSHRVCVMYLGRVVEQATSRDLYDHPLHPYSRALLSAVPFVDPGRRKLRVLLEGDVPSPIDPPGGCAFHPRCPRAEPGKCDVETPHLAEVDLGSGHRVACFHPHVD